MPSSPLQPFSWPQGLGAYFPESISALGALTWVFNAVALYWLVYTVIAVYHWFAYSHNANITIPSVVLHLFVSLVLIGYIISGLV